MSQPSWVDQIDRQTTGLFHEFGQSRHAETIARLNFLIKSPPKLHSRPRAKLVILPGALYRERPDMGGDGRVVCDVATEFGYATEMSRLKAWGPSRPTPTSFANGCKRMRAKN